jgi:hypothetical protein
MRSSGREANTASETLGIYRQLAKRVRHAADRLPEASLPRSPTSIVAYLRELFTDAAKKTPALVIGILRAR